MYFQKMIYRPHRTEGGLESGSLAHHVPGTPPPEYDSTHMEYPPDYQDALKDVILSTGMYMHKHTHMQTYAHTYVHTYIHTYIHTSRAHKNGRLE